MQRNLDLLRTILLKSEEIPYGNCVDKSFFQNLGETGDKIVYHIDLLLDSGYIVGDIYSTIGTDKNFDVYRLTSAGCDYLDSVRNNDVWNKTKDKLLSVGSSASLAVVKAIAEGVTLALINNQPRT